MVPQQAYTNIGGLWGTPECGVHKMWMVSQNRLIVSCPLMDETGVSTNSTSESYEDHSHYKTSLRIENHAVMDLPFMWMNQLWTMRTYNNLQLCSMAHSRALLKWSTTKSSPSFMDITQPLRHGSSHIRNMPHKKTSAIMIWFSRR